MIPRSVRRKLPKAKLLKVEVGGFDQKPYLAKFRCANFMRVQLWWVCITFRMPWLERPARQIHPHLFSPTEIKGK